MADTRGVFTLQEVIPIKLEEGWVPLSDVWVAPSPSGLQVNYTDGTPAPNTGYFGGGGIGVFVTMDKVNYSTDTTAQVPGASLSSARYKLSATGNSTNGYFGGGIPQVTTMDKIQYSNDTRLPTIPGAALRSNRSSAAATGNATAGYFAGGRLPFPGGLLSSIDKITYSNDTTLLLPATTLSAVRRNMGATGNQSFGYFGGGDPGPVTTMDKIQYSNDTRAIVPGAALSAARTYLAATGNSTNGYFGGGFAPGGYFSTVNKLTYTSDTTAAVPGAALSAARSGLAATGNSTDGYFGGGRAFASLATMDKVTYATDTRVAVPSAALSAARYYLAATSARTNALPQPLAPTSTPVTSLALGPALGFGYFGGGKIFINPIRYFYSTIDKITYSNDTTAAVPGAALSLSRSRPAATGNSTHGYFGGGWAGSGLLSTVDKIDYTTDTRLATIINLSVGGDGLAATGNSTDGYFGGGRAGGGFTTTSNMNKLTYSSDTILAFPNANLSTPRYGGAATGNSTHGYFGGGAPGPAYHSTMDKIQYSTDTRLPAIPTAPLSAAKAYFSATGNSTAGYFGGGRTNTSYFSTVDKLTYSSDTTLAVPSLGSLSTPRYDHGATGNSTAGYFGGGTGPLSSVDKIDFTTDTRLSAIPGANLSFARDSVAATSPLANTLPSSAQVLQSVPNIV
jgi:hypothetical protein